MNTDQGPGARGRQKEQRLDEALAQGQSPLPRLESLRGEVNRRRARMAWLCSLDKEGRRQHRIEQHTRQSPIRLSRSSYEYVGELRGLSFVHPTRLRSGDR